MSPGTGSQLPALFSQWPQRPPPSSHRAEFSLFAPDSWYNGTCGFAHCLWFSGTPRGVVWGALWVLPLIYFQGVPRQLVAVRTLSPHSSVGMKRPGNPIPAHPLHFSSPASATRLLPHIVSDCGKGPPAFPQLQAALMREQLSRRGAGDRVSGSSTMRRRQRPEVPAEKANGGLGASSISSRSPCWNLA